LARNQNTYEKQRREAEKKRKAAEKRQDKQLKKDSPPTPRDSADPPSEPRLSLLAYSPFRSRPVRRSYRWSVTTMSSSCSRLYCSPDSPATMSATGLKITASSSDSQTTKLSPIRSRRVQFSISRLLAVNEE
jgi:hypothetical protein